MQAVCPVAYMEDYTPMSGGLKQLREYIEATRGAKVVIRLSDGQVFEVVMTNDQADQLVELTKSFGLIEGS
jgi:hypothetical protein